MKILIIGGGGYIGSRLVPELLGRGYHVSVIDTFMFGNHLPTDVFTLKKDIFDITEEDMKSSECVIFLAGLSNDPMAEYSPSENFVSNAAGPAYTAYVAAKSGVKRYIYAGSCSVYGYTENSLYTEEDPTVVSYPYGISKLQGEKVSHLQSSDFSVVILRQGTVSGHSPRMRFDLVVNTMFKCAMQDGVIVVNNPSIWRPILSIRDAVSAYIRAIEANQEVNGIFNIASCNCTMGFVADRVKEKIESAMHRKVQLNIRNIADYRNYKASIEKAKHILSFYPQHNIQDITQELCEHIQEYKNLENENYYNIRVFKKWKKH